MYAFQYCESLKIIKLPSAVIEVGAHAFSSCCNLRHAILNEGLLILREYVFYQCESLESIKLPSAVTEVGACTFARCCNLRHVEFNEGLFTIERAAFSGCIALKRIKLPSSVIELGVDAFECCSKLRDVMLNEGIITIGRSAFRGCVCVSFGSIKLPSTVTEVGAYAFRDCRALRNMELNDGLDTIGDHAFSGCLLLECFRFPCIYTRLDAISHAGQTAAESVTSGIPGVSRSLGDLLISFDAMEGGQNWRTFRESLRKICRLITYHELKEATSIIELALWKAKIEKKRGKTREDCRVLCKANIIIRGVLEFCHFSEGW